MGLPPGETILWPSCVSGWQVTASYLSCVYFFIAGTAYGPLVNDATQTDCMCFLMEIDCMNKRRKLQPIVGRQARPGFIHVRADEQELIQDARARVHNSIDPVADIGYDLGIPPWWMRIEDATMILKRSDEHQAALATVPTGMRRHPNSHLDPARFTEEELAILVGPTERDISKITSWMTSQELTSLNVSPARTSINFSGTLLAVEAAFDTEFHLFRWEGKEYLANVCELSIPAAFSAVVSGFCHFNSFVPSPKTNEAGRVLSRRRWYRSCSRQM
jgi:hypothetical protein